MEHAGQHELPHANPWQWPNPSPQQALLLMVNLTTDDATTDCFAINWGAFWVTPENVGLFLPGQACEVSTVTNVTSVNVATTREAKPSIRRRQRNALPGHSRRRSDFGAREINMLRRPGLVTFGYSRSQRVKYYRTAKWVF